MYLLSRTEKVCKALCYIALLLAFLICYFYEEVVTFLRGNTSFTSTYQKVPTFDPPSIILCMPYDISKEPEHQMNYTSVNSVIFDKDEKYKKFNKTPMDAFREINFSLGTDFGIVISFYGGSVFNLKLGK